MLGKVVIENYRSCVHTVINLHPQISVLIGPNGSGKTNILQALMLLNKLTLEERIRAPEPDSAGSINSLIKATFEESKLTLTLSALIAAYTDQSNNDVIRGSRQRWRVKGKNKERASFEMPLAFLSRQHSLFDSYARDKLHFWSIRNRRHSLRSKIPEWSWNALSDVADYCRGMTYYGASQFTNPGTVLLPSNSIRKAVEQYFDCGDMQRFSTRCTQPENPEVTTITSSSWKLLGREASD
jgi:hypothetical protein